MRALGAWLAAGACVLLGLTASRRLTERENMLQGWDAALLRMEGEVRRGGTLPEVLYAGAGKDNAVLAALARRMAETPAAPPEALLNHLPWDGLMAEPEKETLLQCLFSLFSPSLAQQGQALSYAREQWAACCLKARAARERDGRLYAGLGWLAGAAAFILLC